MSWASRAFHTRWQKLVALASVAAVVIGLIAIAPAFGAPPQQECKSDSWNGEYWKQQFDNNQQPSSGGIETSAGVSADAIVITEPVTNLQVKWTNNSDFAVFRTYEKNGRAPDDQTDLNPAIPPGSGGTIEIVRSLSHITFCFTVQAPSIEVSKSTSPGAVGEDGVRYIPVDPDESDDLEFGDVGFTATQVTWTYTVENTGNVPMTNVMVTDTPEGVIPGPASGDTGNDSVLGVGETWTYTKTGSATPGTWGDPPVGYTNTVNVTATSAAGGASDSASSGYYGSNPSLSIEVSDPGVVTIGDPIEWIIDIENTGNVPLEAVVTKELVDPEGGGDPVESAIDCEIVAKNGEVYDEPIASPGCNLGDLDPGDTVQLRYTTDPLTTDDDGSSEFRVEGNDPIDMTIGQDSGDVEFTINNPPIPGTDEYSVAERTLDSSGNPTSAQLIVDGVTEDDLLFNDSDADSDVLTVVGNPTEAAPGSGNGGTFSPYDSNSDYSDGTFVYEPADDYAWPEDDSGTADIDESRVRVDEWEYVVTDGIVQRTGSIEITVTRKLCLNEPISTPSGLDIEATFTLVVYTDCKDFPTLTATEGATPIDGTILFAPPEQDASGTYLGELTVHNVPVADGDVDELVLKYDLLGGDPQTPVPSCVPDPDSEIDGVPFGLADPADAYCFYDVDPDLVGVNGAGVALWDFTWYLLGEDDPSFGFK